MDSCSPNAARLFVLVLVRLPDEVRPLMAFPVVRPQSENSGHLQVEERRGEIHVILSLQELHPVLTPCHPIEANPHLSYAH